MIIPGAIYWWKDNQDRTILPSTSESKQTIQQLAANITVKIWATEPLGSGIIWESQASDYLVITNKHVLRAGKFPYYIQTVDGHIYLGKVVNDFQLDDYDIAVLLFETADKSYETATIGNFTNSTVGEQIIAAGFPYNQDNSNLDFLRSPNLPLGLELKTGRISVILDQALEEGYQIGYTSDVQKGMSGGPLLNMKGEVIGINGKHAYPLWDAPDFYEDGSMPCPSLQKLITRSSLAIPLQTIFLLTPPSTFLPNYRYDKRKSFLSNQKPIVVNLNQEKQAQTLIAQMQAEAELSKSCREFSENSDLLESD